MALLLTNLEKAIASLDTALQAYSSGQATNDVWKEMGRDAVIQRFEYTFELCQKILKRFLEQYSMEKPDTFTNKEIFRIGFEQGIIQDPEAWFIYLKNRNLTSHTYNSQTAEEIYSSVNDFLQDARFLLAQIQKKID